MIARKMRLVLLEHALGTVRLIGAELSWKSSPAPQRVSALWQNRRERALFLGAQSGRRLTRERGPVKSRTRKTRPRTYVWTRRTLLIHFAFATLCCSLKRSGARQLGIMLLCHVYFPPLCCFPLIFQRSFILNFHAFLRLLLFYHRHSVPWTVNKEFWVWL